MLKAVGNDRSECGTGKRAWAGWRPLTVVGHTFESDFVTSFFLRPSDGSPIAHRPGQHLTLLLDIPGRPRLKRSYSISSAPGGHAYRISVKRETFGLASNWIHKSLQTGAEIPALAPQGSFVLPKAPPRPIVLLSGGVGLTPLVSMLGALTGRNATLPVHFIHSTANRATHVFADHIREIAAASPNLHSTVFYSRPGADDVEGRDYDIAGRIDMGWLSENTPLADADFYMCGPRPFMRRFALGLINAGVPRQQIHAEFFGPVEDLYDGETDFEAPLGAPTNLERPRRAAQPRSDFGFGEEDVGRALLASAADGLVASDRAGHIVLWNSGAERIFGYSADEAVGRTLDLIIPEPFRERHWQGYRAVMESGVSRYGTGDILAVPGRHKDGHRISLEFTITPLKRPDNRIVGMVATMRDVTRRFEETKALRKRVAELGGEA